MNTLERLEGQTTHSAQKWIVRLLLVATLTLSTSGCAKEPELNSITAVAFNYSQEYVLDIWVNGKSAGSLLKPAKLGEVTGGGKYQCCIALSPKWKSIEVDLRVGNKTESGLLYKVQASIRQPWPSVASYAVFHILPGKKVVIEIVPTGVEPDMKLLAQRITELGLKP